MAIKFNGNTVYNVVYKQPDGKYYLLKDINYNGNKVETLNKNDFKKLTIDFSEWKKKSEDHIQFIDTIDILFYLPLDDGSNKCIYYLFNSNGEMMSQSTSSQGMWKRLKAPGTTTISGGDSTSFNYDKFEVSVPKGTKFKLDYCGHTNYISGWTGVSAESFSGIETSVEGLHFYTSGTLYDDDITIKSFPSFEKKYINKRLYTIYYTNVKRSNYLRIVTNDVDHLTNITYIPRWFKNDLDKLYAANNYASQPSDYYGGTITYTDGTFVETVNSGYIVITTDFVSRVEISTQYIHPIPLFFGYGGVSNYGSYSLYNYISHCYCGTLDYNKQSYSSSLIPNIGITGSAYKSLGPSLFSIYFSARRVGMGQSIGYTSQQLSFSSIFGYDKFLPAMKTTYYKLAKDSNHSVTINIGSTRPTDNWVPLVLSAYSNAKIKINTTYYTMSGGLSLPSSDSVSSIDMYLGLRYYIDITKSSNDFTLNIGDRTFTDSKRLVNRCSYFYNTEWCETSNSTDANGITYSLPHSTGYKGGSSSNPLTLNVSCLTSGTKILLADKTEKIVDELTFNDQLLVYDFVTGKIEKQYPSMIIAGNNEYVITQISLEDGESIDIIGSHGFYDPIKKIIRDYGISRETDISTLEGLDEDLYIQTYRDDKLITRKVVDIKQVICISKAFSIDTAGGCGYFANGMLSKFSYLNILGFTDDNKFEKFNEFKSAFDIEKDSYSEYIKDFSKYKYKLTEYSYYASNLHYDYQKNKLDATVNEVDVFMGVDTPEDGINITFIYCDGHEETFKKNMNDIITIPKTESGWYVLSEGYIYNSEDKFIVKNPTVIKEIKV